MGAAGHTTDALSGGATAGGLTGGLHPGILSTIYNNNIKVNIQFKKTLYHHMAIKNTYL